MTTKKTLGALSFLLLCLTPSCGEGERGVTADDHPASSVKQALCLVPQSAPTPVQWVPARFLRVSSRGYDYGSGPCDGWTVGFMNEIPATGVYTRAYLGSTVSLASCASTTLRMTVWQRSHGGLDDYAYAGTAEAQAFVSNGACVGSLQLDASLGGQGHGHDIVIKAQVATTTTGGGLSATSNLPVEVEIR